MIKKEGIKICTKCFKKINLKTDKFVFIGTYNSVGGKDVENFFHFVCFVDWYNQKVIEKARNSVQFMQQKAMQLFNNPVMKSMLSQITGSEQVLRMLQTPLEKKNEDHYCYHVENPEKRKMLKEQIKKKIQNDRKKRRKKR